MIIDLLNKQKKYQQNLPAIFSDEINFNYYELNERIKVCADQLLNLKINHGDHIAILSNNNIDLVITLFALWEISAIPIPLNIKLTDEELERLIIHSGSKKNLVHNDFKNKLSGFTKIIFPLKDDIHSKINSNISSSDKGKTALILYTSGTTGSPKGVMLSFNNLISSVESAGSHFKFNNKDRWLVSLPLYHIGGIQILIRSVVFGSSMIIPGSLKTNDIIEAMNKFSPTQISFVPTVLLRLIEKNITPIPTIKNVFLGGGPVDYELVKKAVSKGWNIVKVYGSTETSSMVTAISVKDRPNKIKSAGKPLGSTKINIVDENGIPVPANKFGEIIIEGDSVMRGYWNNEEETKKRLVNNKFFTGDTGYLDEDDYLFIHSRRDNLIISGGENINPAEVEEAILSLPGIKQVCVVGLEDKGWGQIAAAIIVISKSSQLSAEKIIELLKPKLASFKIPKKILVVDEIPRTQMGKVMYEEVRKLF